MVLTGASARHPASMTAQAFDAVKYAWITGPGSGQYLTWTVYVDQGGPYDATLMISTGAANQRFSLSVDGGAPISFTVASGSWTRANARHITLSAGSRSGHPSKESAREAGREPNRLAYAKRQPT